MERYQPYLVVGIGGQYAELKDRLGLELDDGQWAFAARPGVGLDFYISQHWLVNVEVAGVVALRDIEALGSSATDIWYLSAGGGIQYRF